MPPSACNNNSTVTSFSHADINSSFILFFFNDTATTEIYTLSLHDALPIYSDTVSGTFNLTITEGTVTVGTNNTLSVAEGSNTAIPSAKLASSNSDVGETGSAHV